MEIQDIINYVNESPCNTNENVLRGMLEALTGGGASGSVTITVNGTYDVSKKAEAVVNVGLVTLTCDGNDAVQYDPMTSEPVGQIQISPIAGNTVLNDQVSLGWFDNFGTPVTALGWASTKAKADAHEYDVTFPLTVTENRTIYLDWEASPEP